MGGNGNMKIYTSYFGNARNIPENYLKMSITRYTPDSIHLSAMLEYAPWPDELWNYKQSGDQEKFTERYKKETLELLNPAEEYQKLETLCQRYGAEAIVLLCYEKRGDFCHRRIVAEWFEEALGITVEEL